MTFDAWLRHGLEHGWISDPFCITHDGAPMTAFEQAEMEEWDDPCLAAVRLWGDNLR